MRKLVAVLAAAAPLAAFAQPVSPETSAPPPAPPPQAAPPPPQYAPPPPQYAPPPPQYAPPPQYVAPPQGQVVQPPPPQYPQAYPPQAYPPPPQYAPPAPAYPPPAARRDVRSPWYAAFSIGGGDGNVRLPSRGGQAGGTYSLHDWFGKGPTTFAFDLGIGATLTPRLLLGGELSVFAAGATYQTPYGDATSSLGMSNLNAVLTFYPWERGLFLRGGVGLASISSSVEMRGPGGKTKVTDSARGGDLALGAGWAFWLGQRFNLSVNLDWSRQAFRSDRVDGASFWRVGLGFGWY